MKYLQRKLICIVFLATAAVFLVSLTILYHAVGFYNSYQADGMTSLISTYNGIVPEYREFEDGDIRDRLPYRISFNEESEYRTRYFIAYVDDDMNLININMEHVAALGEEDAVEMLAEAISDGGTVGYVGEYRFRLAGNMMIFLDCSESFYSRKIVLTLYSGTSAMIIILVALIFAFCSKMIVKPFVENSKRQKQFITDASHELKTPLAIISANAEVLQYKNGGDEWTNNIITQTKRMSKLISDLLTLAKSDEVDSDFVLESVDFSMLTAETVEPYEEVASQKNVTLNVKIEPNIVLNGGAEQLKRLISTLTDNALKYVSENGTVDIELNRSGKNAVFTIFNTAEFDGSIDTSRLFDRFYRVDDSHSSQSGGHGIGLSIADKIARQHGGRVTAKQVKSGITFTASIPTNLSPGKRRTVTD